jgi:hypothetical protein
MGINTVLDVGRGIDHVRLSAGLVPRHAAIQTTGEASHDNFE